MHKVACTRKEMGCIISNLFAELQPLCDCLCSEVAEDELVLTGLISGTDDEYAIVKITDYGFEYYGDVETLNHIRESRCLAGGAACPSEKDGGAAE